MRKPSGREAVWWWTFTTPLLLKLKRLCSKTVLSDVGGKSADFDVKSKDTGVKFADVEAMSRNDEMFFCAELARK
jgi:hypothetical protein